jgi:hypothetical protein
MPASLDQQRVAEVLARLDARLAQIKSEHRSAMEKVLADLRAKKLEALRTALPSNVS